MEVLAIKEAALTVYSGQRMFPLTFQMPESGLALKERRWHASRKGGDVSLGSISASELEVYTCGEAHNNPANRGQPVLSCQKLRRLSE